MTVVILFTHLQLGQESAEGPQTAPLAVAGWLPPGLDRSTPKMARSSDWPIGNGCRWPAQPGVSYSPHGTLEFLKSPYSPAAGSQEGASQERAGENCEFLRSGVCKLVQCDFQAILCVVIVTEMGSHCGAQVGLKIPSSSGPPEMGGIRGKGETVSRQRPGLTSATSHIFSS